MRLLRWASEYTDHSYLTPTGTDLSGKKDALSWESSKIPITYSHWPGWSRRHEPWLCSQVGVRVVTKQFHEVGSCTRPEIWECGVSPIQTTGTERGSGGYPREKLGAVTKSERAMDVGQVNPTVFHSTWLSYYLLCRNLVSHLNSLGPSFLTYKMRDSG